MTTYVGADWADGLWVLVAIQDDTVRIHTEPAILNAWQEYDSETIFLIDMPIGLPEEGSRACDDEASNYLEPRDNTVFIVPTRDAVYAPDYESAKEKNRAAQSNKLGSQSWWLVPRIKEVDIFLEEYPTAKERMYESHPEVCFAKITDDAPLPKKDTKAGFDTRLELLEQMESEATEKIVEFAKERANEGEWHHRIQSGRIDDVLDAAVLALTGEKLGLSTRHSNISYPAFPTGDTHTDSKHLPMEIIHPHERK